MKTDKLYSRGDTEPFVPGTAGVGARPQTFDQWWYDYRIKNGLRIARVQREAALMGWYAAARQNVPQQVIDALRAAYEHTNELRDAWQRGIIDERDNYGGRRSNRNVKVSIKLRYALEQMAPLKDPSDPCRGDCKGIGRCPHDPVCNE